MTNLNKKIKCVHCEGSIERNGVCSCGANIIKENTIIKGVEHADYIDFTPMLLQE